MTAATPATANSATPTQRRHHSRTPRHGGGHEDGEAEARQQEQLVVRPEQVDRQLLRPPGDDVDHERADGHDRTRVAHGQQGHQFGRSEEHAAAHRPGEGGQGDRADSLLR